MRTAKLIPDRLTTTATNISGVLVLLIGTAHFAMPRFGYNPATLSAIPDIQRDHFVYLGTYAIGCFLVAFGILTLVAGRGDRSFFERAFFGVMVAVWGMRVVLEVLYPVNLPLFFLTNPHPVLLSVIALIWLGYLFGFIGQLGCSSG
ncbi:MAG: hypothetical protein AAFR98_13490 [Pseudomonadota bacterium]